MFRSVHIPKALGGEKRASKLNLSQDQALLSMLGFFVIV